MSNELMHYGILGMKWGIRRTPEQLGHKPPSDDRNNGPGDGSKGGKIRSTLRSVKNKISTARTNRAEKKGKARKLSDEELQERIKRLNMEEQYANLVARKKERDTSPVKKLLSDTLSRLGTGIRDRAINEAINKMFSKKDTFDINEWKDKDVNDMDAETISRVSKWYKDAQSITAFREKAGQGSKPSGDGGSRPSGDKGSKPSSNDGSTSGRPGSYDNPFVSRGSGNSHEASRSGLLSLPSVGSSGSGSYSDPNVSGTSKQGSKKKKK